ncbi:MAG: diguanylate cyclase [Firmicutes bacterium]|nr:diguanylate cyclase [Bacillota bacterium]
MNSLNIFICENQAPEIENIVAKLKLGPVQVRPYPCMCVSNSRQKEARRLLKQARDQGQDSIIICSRYCHIRSLLEDYSPWKVLIKDHCFHYLPCPQLVKYISDRGGYVVTTGWLNKWRQHMAAMGFDQQTARRFYQETAQELVCFDTGIDRQLETKLKQLAQFLKLPYTIIPLETTTLEYIIRSIVAEWELKNKYQAKDKKLAEAQTQLAQYAAVLHLLTKIARHTSQREIVEEIKAIFIGIMGAAQFKFHSSQAVADNLPEDLMASLMSAPAKALLLEEENKIFIALVQEDKCYGVLEAGGFLFPQYLCRYLNFAQGIAQISALTLMNIERYEELVNKKEELAYKSSHDALTGLCNRACFNEQTADWDKFSPQLCLFCFDIDNLKQVNDNYGHLEGDKLIKAAADILRCCFRETDLLARTGGDEFIALVEGCNPKMAQMLVQRLRNKVAQYNEQVEPKHLTLGISVGYAVRTDKIKHIKDLIRIADFAMYRDKATKPDLPRL